MSKAFPLALSLTVLLTACGGGKSVPPLEGERITIRMTSVEVKENSQALKAPFKLPPKQNIQHWPQILGGYAHYMPHVELPESVRKSWRKRLGGGETSKVALLNPPVVANGVIYAATTASKIIAFDAKTQKTLWKTKLKVEEDELISENPALAVSTDALFASTVSGDVFAFNRQNGDLLWHKNLALPLSGAPTLAGSYVLLIGQNNSTHVLNQSDGNLVWTHNGLSEVLALEGGASIAVSLDGTAFVPYSSGELYALDLKSGRYLWHDALSFQMSAGSYESLSDINASPVSADGFVYAVNMNGQLSAFDEKTGRRIWSTPLSSSQTPLVVGSVIYVVTEKGEVVCVNRVDGLVRWIQPINETLTTEFNMDEETNWFRPILAGERLFLAGKNGYVVTLNPRTGKVGKVAHLGQKVAVPPLAVDKSILFFTEKANVIAYQ